MRISEPKIRGVTLKDLEAIYEIEKQSFKDPYPSNFLNLLYVANSKTFLVAERSGVIVGYIIASADRDLGHIISIAVHPSDRRKHIGRAIMEEALNIKKSIGVTTVRLEVRQGNIDAQRFYELLNFKKSYSLNSYYGDEDALVYFKKL